MSSQLQQQQQQTQQQQFRSSTGGVGFGSSNAVSSTNSTASLLQQQIQQLQSLHQQQQQQQQFNPREDFFAGMGGGGSSGMNMNNMSNMMNSNLTVQQQLQQLQQQHQLLNSVMNSMNASNTFGSSSNINSNNMSNNAFNPADPLQRAMQAQQFLQHSRQQQSQQTNPYTTDLMNLRNQQFTSSDFMNAKATSANMYELNQPPVDSDLAAHQQRLKRRRSSMSSNDSAGPLAAKRGGIEHFKLSDPSGMSQFPKKKSQRRSKSFPVKLMTTLMEHPHEDAVAWLPDGKSFVVVHPDAFCDVVLKKTFKECKYASFVRKLHRWGFVRLTSGTGTDCFHHPLFQRHRMDMVSRIICTPRETASANPTKQQQLALEVGQPSLQGVEKFFRGRDQEVGEGQQHSTQSEHHHETV
jgi:hypothetical protein